MLPEVRHWQATQQAEAIVKALTDTFVVVGVPYHLDSYVGISHYPNHADNLSEWVRTAVFACHQARLYGSGYAVYDGDWDARDRYRFRLMVDLGRALRNRDQIRVAYQPLVDLESGECVGAEALVRWLHPELGVIPPDQFIGVVEQTSLMLPLTEAVLEQGLADLAAWQRQGFEGQLGVNVCPELFRKPDLLDRLLEHFRFANLSPDRVQFEVTESGLMDQPNQGAHVLDGIRSQGSRIAVDDFGTGRSSLAYLADLPIDTVKIDKHFVQSLSQQWGEAVVGAASTLAHKLGLETVAEGIEDDTGYRKCRELECSFGQGFFIGRPMFEPDFQEWLQN